MLVRGRVIAVLLVACSIDSLQGAVDTAIHEEKVGRVLHGLQRSVSWYGRKEVIKREDIDGLTGVNIALVAARLAAGSRALPASFKGIVSQLVTDLRTVQQRSVLASKARNPSYYKQFKPMMRHSVLSAALVESAGSTFGLRQLRPVTQPAVAPNRRMPFHEDASDICMSGLLGTDGQQRCTVADGCMTMMTRPLDHRYTYFLTHQVLYFSLARRFGCTGEPAFLQQVQSASSMDLEQLINQKCSTILLNLQSHPVGTDISFEQIFTCGQYGYKEFFRDQWLQAILAHQHSEGCFKENNVEVSSNQVPVQDLIQLQRGSILPDNCSVHKTATATGALSLYLVQSLNLLEQQPGPQTTHDVVPEVN